MVYFVHNTVCPHLLPGASQHEHTLCTVEVIVLTPLSCVFGMPQLLHGALLRVYFLVSSVDEVQTLRAILYFLHKHTFVSMLFINTLITCCANRKQL